MTGNERLELLTKFIVESDAIEGIIDDPEIVKQEILENKTDGHVGALLYLESKVNTGDYVLGHTDVEHVQKLITAEQHLKRGGEKLELRYRGRYRDCGVAVGGRLCPAPALVRPLMDELLDNLRRSQEDCRSLDSKKVIEHIADFHFHFENIHPFVDGNGRTGRALVYFLFFCADIKPFIFTARDRYEKYYPCFREARPRLMRQYFLERCARAV